MLCIKIMRYHTQRTWELYIRNIRSESISESRRQLCAQTQLIISRIQY